MSHVTTPDSPVELPFPEKRAIDPSCEQKSTDRIDALFKDVPFQQKTIATLKEHLYIEKLARFLEKTPNLVEKAKEILAGIPESEEGVEKFSNEMRRTWPSLASGIRKTFDSRVDLVGLVVRCANRDSATLRWARTKADPALKSSLAILESPATPEFDLLRLFLSVLVGYWGDRAQLPKQLDAAIDSPIAFGYTVYICERKKGNQYPVVFNSYQINKAFAKDAKDDDDDDEWLVWSM